MIDLPPPLVIPEKPALVMPAPHVWVPGPRRVQDWPPIFSMAVPGAPKPASSDAPPVTLTWIDYALSGANALTYDFGDFTAASDGLMIVGGAGRNPSQSRFLSEIRIDDVDGVVVQSETENICGAIGAREISAGDINVTIQFNNTVSRAGVGVWLLTGYQSATPTDTDSQHEASADPSTSLDVLAGGAAVHFVGNTNAATSITWSGDVTERFDDDNEIRYSAADKTPLADLTGDVVEADGGSSSSALMSASWR